MNNIDNMQFQKLSQLLEKLKFNFCRECVVTRVSSHSFWSTKGGCFLVVIILNSENYVIGKIGILSARTRPHPSLLLN